MEKKPVVTAEEVLRLIVRFAVTSPLRQFGPDTTCERCGAEDDDFSHPWILGRVAEACERGELKPGAALNRLKIIVGHEIAIWKMHGQEEQLERLLAEIDRVLARG